MNDNQEKRPDADVMAEQIVGMFFLLVQNHGVAEGRKVLGSVQTAFDLAYLERSSDQVVNDR